MKIKLALVVLLAAPGVHCGGEQQPPLDPSSNPPAGVTADPDAAAPQAPPGEVPKK